MRKCVVLCLAAMLFVLPSYAQWGNLIKNVQNSPLLTQQNTVRDTITRITNIKDAFTKMPLNQGKLSFIAAALPVLNEVYTLSSGILGMFQKNKTLDTAGSNKMNGLLGEVENLLARQWDTAPLAPSQTPEADQKVQQTTKVLTDILTNEGGLLKALLSK